MKYGLTFENGKLKSKYGRVGGVGHYIADGLADNLMYYLPICNFLFKLKLLEINSSHLVKYHRASHTYIEAGYQLANIVNIDEFEPEEELASVSMGYIPTIDLVLILENYIEVLKRSLKYTNHIVWEIIFRKIWIYLDQNPNFYFVYTQDSNRIDISLSSIMEIEVNSMVIAKVYRVYIENDQIVVKKNRQYKNDLPTIFPVDKIDQFFEWLIEDAKEWDKVIKEFYYEDRKLLFRDYKP